MRGAVLRRLGLRPRTPSASSDALGMSSDCVLGVLGLLRRPRTASSAEWPRVVSGRAVDPTHRRGVGSTHPAQRLVGGGPLSPRPLPARRGKHGRGDSCQLGGARLFSFLPVKGRGDVMPLQRMEMRLFVKGQVLEVQGVVKALSLSLSPSPPPRTPTTKPGRALYGLDFSGFGELRRLPSRGARPLDANLISPVGLEICRSGISGLMNCRSKISRVMISRSGIAGLITLWCLITGGGVGLRP